MNKQRIPKERTTHIRIFESDKKLLENRYGSMKSAMMIRRLLRGRH